MCDVFSVRGKNLEPERACTLCVHLWCKVKAFYRGWWTLCFSSELKFLELWLNQKRLALVVRALAVKGQTVLLRTWTLSPDNAAEPVNHQNRTKRGSRAKCQRWRALVCIDHFQVFCNDFSHPWNTNLGWFYPGRSGGHVVPRWKSPDVMVSVSSRWKSAQIMVSVSSGENDPTLWLEWVFCFPVDTLTL